MITLLPDQSESIEATATVMRRGVKSVLLQGATGSGKSYIASELVRRARAKNKRVMYSVPRRELIRQMAGTFTDFGMQYSYIAAGYSENPLAQLQIASTDTLKSRLNRIAAPDLAIIDETHFGAEGLDRIIKWLKANGSYIIGLSATPWRLSGMGLGCWYDEMVCGPSVRWLIDNKRLSDYRAFAPSTLDLSQIDVRAGDYAKGQLAEKMEQDRVLIGNAVKHYVDHAKGRLGVTFTVSRKHSELMAQAYRDAGVTAVHIDGETPDDERRRIAIGAAKGEIDQLCNVDLLTFGYDLASASGIKGKNIQIMSDCAPSKSLSKQSQKWGRNLRYDGSQHLFFDHANNFSEHGLPCDEREWTLEDRIKKKGHEGEKTIAVRQCPAPCFFAHKPAPQCPQCGHVYEIQYRQIEEVEGELAEIQAGIVRKKARQEVGRARTLEDLKRIASERGYKPVWAMQMARVKGMRL